MRSLLISVLRVTQPRFTAVRKRHYEALLYRSHGQPDDVIKMEKMTLPDIGAMDVRLRMLAAPVNPADINMIQGTYGILPSLPAVGGNEGLAEVIEVGNQVTALSPGDWVIPVDAEFGTWRIEAVCNERDLIPVPNDIPLLSAATIGVNPCTAYRMLHDFIQLKSGDTVIQNGANSAVGQAVIQIAASMGIETINIVRNRPDLHNLVQKLKALGANYIIAEEQLHKASDENILKDVPKPKLALNCVGGPNAAYLVDHLDYGGKLVTYGGMSKKPALLPAKAVIFRNITVEGFWMTQWKRNNKQDISKLQSMVADLCELVKTGKLSSPLCTKIPFQDYKQALSAALQPFQGRKHVLIM
ncbi:enoyl-[acyl-carrier-protein] reductase, mitochondrial [Polypterus senegalus]|uniref:enoyl-[acyl-carrier-protein] reductase, mitochondrial n=1 Tax=Polypterus senegalus TaxID=55291 RepID=UPI001965B469|nr:enoyl-[acyl-carrier-protein] reductase, mitochondrial [Polypterus senegalus]